MNTTKHTAEPWEVREYSQDIQVAGPGFREVALVRRILPLSGECPTECRVEQVANAARIVQCVNACAKFPDPAAALTDLRQLIGQARGLIDEGALSQADNMLIAALGVLDGEEG